ncbi:lactose permease [Thozetella sp. PMI_491]|nr:lactose permease [Thozetella sp. PMI_491]
MGKQAELSVGAELAAALPQDAKPWYRTRHLVLLNLALLVPLLSSATIGFDGAMMNGLQTLVQWRSYFGNPSAPVLGAMNAIFPIGKIVGILPSAWLVDRYGRKSSLWVGFIFLMIAAGLQGGSINVAMFIVSRFILGAATAFIAQPSPILVTELAYPTHRGKITAMYQTFFYFGSIFAAWSTYGTFRLDSSWSWRIPSILQAAIPFFQFLALAFVPESPRWLLANGKIEQAREILIKWHAGGDRDSALVVYEMQQIEQSVMLESQARAETSYLDLIRTAPNRKRTLIAAIVGFFAQWNGAGVVSYYLTLVLNTIGIKETKDQALINGLLQIFNWLSAIFAGALMVDRLGRRTLFLTSVAGMLVSYIIWTALTAYFTSTLNATAGNAVVAFIFIYYFFYDIAFAPLLLLYPCEIFEYGLRARGVAVTYSSTFIGLIIGQFVNPIAMSGIGWKYYIVFCCILAVLWPVMYFLFPETKGRTLEEIAEIFDGKSRRVGEIEKIVETEADQVEHARTIPDTKV